MITVTRNWLRYAKALDMRLEGARLDDIASELGVSRERARQMVVLAEQQLAFRVFKGLRRPLPKQWWEHAIEKPEDGGPSLGPESRENSRPQEG